MQILAAECDLGRVFHSPKTTCNMIDEQESNWIDAEIADCVQQYGDVPPLWVFAPDSHPISLQWRMGGGEAYAMVFNRWIKANLHTEEERIAYFRKYPAPPRWLQKMAASIWKLEPWKEENFDFAPYFERLKALGFEGTDQFEADFEDEKWVAIEAGGLGESEVDFDAIEWESLEGEDLD
jgi:hypothetical protein